MKILEEGKKVTLKVILCFLNSLEASIDGNSNILLIEKNLMEILEIINIDPNYGMLFRVLLS